MLVSSGLLLLGAAINAVGIRDIGAATASPLQEVAEPTPATA
jgi:hypothetical protein